MGWNNLARLLLTVAANVSKFKAKLGEVVFVR